MAAANVLSTCAQAGAVFNDVTRQNVTEEGGQGPGTPVAIVADLQTRTGDANRGRQTA
jgi:hypothetical protein